MRIKDSGLVDSDQKAPPTSPPPPRKLIRPSATPFDLRSRRGPNGERTSGLCASGLTNIKHRLSASVIGFKVT